MLRKNVFSVGCIFLGLCWVMTATAMTMPPSIPMYHNPALTIKVSAKQPQFEIVQSANPTTGYSWTTPAYNAELLKLISAKYERPRAENTGARARMGAGGHMIWTFHAMSAAFQQPSPTQIQLTYQRPWAPKDHPKSVVFKVKFIPVG